MKPWLFAEQGRPLMRADLIGMRLPERCWETTVKRFGGGPSVIERLKSYAFNLRKMRQDGIGLFLNGPNGVGKSCIVAHYGKAFRSHGQSVLYARAVELVTSSIETYPMGDAWGGLDLWQLAKQVDVLILDDLGKEHRSQSSYAETMIEDLLRARYERKGVTLITTNMSGPALVETYKASTLSIIKAMTISLTITGEDQRQQKYEADLMNTGALAP